MENFSAHASQIFSMTFFAFLVGVLPCLIIGAIANRKGRSMGWWMLGPMLITIGVMFLFILIIPDALSDGAGIWSITMGYVFPVIWVIALISILIAGKTNEKKMQEIAQEERMREQIRQRE